MASSRTNLRLQLMREQSMLEKQQQQQQQHGFCVSESFNMNDNSALIDALTSSSPRNSNTHMTASALGGGVGSSGSSGDGSAKASPIIISQPIRFSGNRLVHLPPQIIHVQQQLANEDMGRRNLTLSSSLPPGLPQNSPPKMPHAMKASHIDSGSTRVKTAHYTAIQQHQQERRVPSGTASTHSPDEMSPGGYGDSPRSNSFTSAQSELDDIIIGEILSMEEEQQKGNTHGMSSKISNSLSYADSLEALLNTGRPVPFHRQVSNSAPTSTIDIEGLVREEMMQEQEMVRDRRKKDIHNMIERRRRYNINDRIKELGTLLPKSCTEDIKLNKGTILRASVEYIRALRRDQEKAHQIIQRFQSVDHENKIMALRIQELEQRMKQHGVPVPTRDSSYCISNDNRLTTDRPIKAEPVDDDQTPQPRPDHPAPSFHTLSSLHRPPVHHQQLPPLPEGRNINQSAPNRFQHPPPPPRATAPDYSNPMMSGTGNYAISSTDSQFSSYYSTTASFGGEAGVLETPPVVSNNLSVFGGGRPSLELSNQQQGESTTMSGQERTTNSELMMELGDQMINGVASSTVGNLVSSSTAALISSTDPLMSDSRLISSQIASPEVHWDSQAFSPDAERMDFVSH